MKKSILIIPLMLLFGVFNAQSQASLEVTVAKVKSSEGLIVVSIFNSEKEFLGKAFKQMKTEASSGQMKFAFTDLPEGAYTISVYHDENNNGQLDKNFIGMPVEPYGISKEGKSSFGPPNYKDALFNVSERKNEILIEL